MCMDEYASGLKFLVRNKLVPLHDIFISILLPDADYILLEFLHIHSLLTIALNLLQFIIVWLIWNEHLEIVFIC